jgi:hypothetical protein
MLHEARKVDYSNDPGRAHHKNRGLFHINDYPKTNRTTLMMATMKSIVKTIPVRM